MYAVASLDEAFQAERWGEDPDAARKRDQVTGELVVAARLTRLCRGEDDLALPLTAEPRS